jgi:hypothetical protein
MGDGAMGPEVISVQPAGHAIRQLVGLACGALKHTLRFWHHSISELGGAGGIGGQNGAVLVGGAASDQKRESVWPKGQATCLHVGVLGEAGQFALQVNSQGRG